MQSRLKLSAEENNFCSVSLFLYVILFETIDLLYLVITRMNLNIKQSIVTIAFATLSLAASSSTPNLLPCGGDDVSLWNQCVGETKVMVDGASRTYIGEFEKGLPHGRGVRVGPVFVKDKEGRPTPSLMGNGKELEVKTVGFFREGKVWGYARVTRNDGTHTIGLYKENKFVEGENKYFITYSSGFFGTTKNTELVTYTGSFNDKGERDGDGILYDEKRNLIFCGKFDNDEPRIDTKDRDLQSKFQKICEDGFKQKRDIRERQSKLIGDPSMAQKAEVPQIEAYVNQQLALKSRLAQPAARLIDPLGSEVPNCAYANAVLRPRANLSRDQGPSVLKLLGGRAPSQLGYLYLLGCSPEFNVDLEEALYWIELAVKAQDPAAIHNLAWMHQNGYGATRDDARAASLYRTLADSAERTPVQRRAARENLTLIAPEIVQAATALPSAEQSTQAPLVSQTVPMPAAVATAPPPPIPANSLAPVPSSTNPPSLPISGSGKKRALVIGNDTYKSVQALVNAREDARAVADQFRTLGYEVTLGLDLNERMMKRTLRVFSEQVQGGDEIVFFFAGHGVQLGPANYLLPVDISGESEGQVRDESIPLQRILDDFSDRKARFTLAILDACRDNPFKSTGRNIGARGLAATTAATGQMVIFSAGVGQQALDRVGSADKNRNGLFTRVFLKEIKKPGLSVDKVLRNVRTEVVETARSIGHDQVPAIYDQVVGEFYFRR